MLLMIMMMVPMDKQLDLMQPFQAIAEDVLFEQWDHSCFSDDCCLVTDALSERLGLADLYTSRQTYGTNFGNRGFRAAGPWVVRSQMALQQNPQ